MQDDEINYLDEATGFLDERDPATAIQLCTIGIEIGSNNELWYGPQKVRLYRLRSRAYQVLKNYDAAIFDATTVVALYLDFPEYGDLAWVYNWRGYLHLMKGDHPKAVEDYTLAINSSPKNYYYYFERGLARKAQGLISEAIQDLRTASELVDKSDPNVPRIHWILTKLEG